MDELAPCAEVKRRLHGRNARIYRVAVVAGERGSGVNGQVVVPVNTDSGEG